MEVCPPFFSTSTSFPCWLAPTAIDEIVPLLDEWNLKLKGLCFWVMKMSSVMVGRLGVSQRAFASLFILRISKRSTQRF